MSWFDVPTTQMPTFLLFPSAGVLFDGAFSLKYPSVDKTKLRNNSSWSKKL